MTTEPDYNAFYRCKWCHCLRPVKETIIHDRNIFCRDNPTCMEKYNAHYIAIRGSRNLLWWADEG